MPHFHESLEALLTREVNWSTNNHLLRYLDILSLIYSITEIARGVHHETTVVIQLLRK